MEGDILNSVFLSHSYGSSEECSMVEGGDPLLCDTCQYVIDKYGTNEYVSPWLCKCIPENSIPLATSRQKTLTKGFGMRVTENHDLVSRRFRYHRPDLWDHSVD